MSQSKNIPPCLLCGDDKTAIYHQDRSREYAICPTCHLAFVLPTYFLTPADEKAHYDLHENDPTDQRYRQFLGRLFEPIHALISPKSSGLDFGSGPGPTLSIMFQEMGHSMAIYDPFYAPNQAVFGQTYDFITATEVLEHLHNPAAELDRIWACLKPGGWLGIMTKRLTDLDAFKKWHYKNDPTHVCFFSEQTFEHLAQKWNATHQLPSADVAIFRKSKQNRPIST